MTADYSNFVGIVSDKQQSNWRAATPAFVGSLEPKSESRFSSWLATSPALVGPGGKIICVPGASPEVLASLVKLHRDYADWVLLDVDLLANASPPRIFFTEITSHAPKVSVDSEQETISNVLDEAFEESCKPNWDGYSASAVTREAYLKAKRFLDCFPMSLPAPEVSVDPDGEVSFEWYVSASRAFSISVGTNGELTYAGIFNASKTHGIEVFHDKIPRIILDNIRRIYSN